METQRPPLEQFADDLRGGDLLRMDSPFLQIALDHGGGARCLHAQAFSPWT